MRTKQFSHFSGAAIVASACLLTPALVTASTWDLRNDWSDTVNPNSAWSLNAAATPLPHIDNWALTTFDKPQGGWAQCESCRGFWFKASSSPLDPLDWLHGDVVVHTQDQFGDPYENASNVTWTSPINGVVDISGSVWMDDAIPERGNQWNLYVDGALVSSGQLTGSDSYSRSSPFVLATGSGGAAVLQGVRVNVGDVVRLELVRTTFDGFFVGTELTVSSVPEPSSYLLLLGGLATLAALIRKRRTGA